MRVIQVVPRIVTASSGPSQSVPALSAALVAAGAEVELNLLAPVANADIGLPLREHANMFGPPFDRLGISPALRKYLGSEAPSTDVIHTHGLWMMPNVYPYKACLGHRCRTVLSPRGTLDPWALARSRGKKHLFSLFGQRRALERADLLHVTSEQELGHVRDYGLTQPVAVVRNGVEAPTRVRRRSLRDVRAPRILLFLSRLHQKKGLDMLLAAWAKVAPERPEWVLHVAGPVDSDWARALRERYEGPKARFLGEVSGSLKWHMLAEADSLVLPSHGENFGMAVAEALAAGTPVVVSDRTPWTGIEERRCGWLIQPNEDSIRRTLQKVCAESADEMSAAGKRGMRWMHEAFSWRSVGGEMLEAYRWLLGDAPVPSFVDLGTARSRAR